jgi:hypothetical protein
MQTQQTFGEANVARWNPYVSTRPETHLEFTVWYVSADGRMRWATGTMHWDDYPDAATLQADVLNLQTDFVKQQWSRIEVNIPNRDNYGNLRPGFIKDTGLLLMTREVLH